MFICLANEQYFCYNDIVYFDERGYLLMDKNEYCHIQNIISQYLSKDTRVMDLRCGYDYFSKWIKENNLGKIVPLSPKYLEHIDHENPFVAYNNFINDSRKIPTKNKADVVLLLGPLYTMESGKKRTHILSEIKRLVATDGKVITLSKCSNKKSCSEEFLLNNAGFTVDEVAEIPLKNNTSAIKDYEKYYLTVATPKPVITEYDVPPEVYVRIPERIAIQHNIKIKDISQIENDVNSHKENTFHKKHNIFSFREIKRSVEPILQIGNIKKSIDSTLQPKWYFSNLEKYTCGVKIKLPILSKEISKNINQAKESKPNDNTKELAPKEEKKETKKIKKSHIIKIFPSIDKNLVVRSDKNKVQLPSVSTSIDRSLQVRIKKVNPLFDKPKSKKKGTNNLIK